MKVMHFRRIVTILFVAVSLIAGPAYSAEHPTETALKAVKKLLEQSEKQTKDSALKAQLKSLKRQADTLRKAIKKQDPKTTLQQLVAFRRKLREIPAANLKGNPVERITQLIVTYGGYSLRTQNYFGLQEFTFVTPEGAITIQMPDDPRTGETISGTSFAFGVADQAGLGRYTLEFSGNPIPVSSEKTQWKLVLSDAAQIRLQTPEATVVGQSAIKQFAASLPREYPRADITPPADLEQDWREPREPVVDIDIAHLLFQMTPVNQAGKPVEIRGNFDGDSSTTIATINKEPAVVIAESPRKAIIENPRVAGRCQLRVEELEKTVRCMYQNIDVRVWASASTIGAGANEVLSIRVDHIPDESPPLRLILRNHNPDIVSLQDGPVQYLPLELSSITSGSISLSKVLTGMHPAPFFIDASLDTSYRFTNCVPPEY